MTDDEQTTGEEAAAADEGLAAHEEQEHADEARPGVPAHAEEGEQIPDRNKV